MHSYDAVMIAVLVVATLVGAWRGLVWQLASLLSMVASYFVAFKLSPIVTPLLGGQPPWDRIVVMFVLCVVTALVIWGVFRKLSHLLARLKLKTLDRQFGAVVGLGVGVLLCVVITLFAAALLPEVERQAVVRSHSGYYIAVGLAKAHTILPDEAYEVLGPYLREAREYLDRRVSVFQCFGSSVFRL